ncbi:MAG TPA: hypothetical protein VG406_21880 [Isosphaeraceae bacterium]|nr:hypothetical protein [Isosphaeraceae bacterium]
MESELYANKMDDVAVSTERFSLVCVDGRWKTENARGVRFTAKGIYIFVVQYDRLFIAKRRAHRVTKEPINHIDLAHGKMVQFAGEARFGSRRRRGMLRIWNDRTGHFYDPKRPMNPGVVPILPRDLFERYLGF